MSFLNPARSKLLEIFALNGAMVRGSGARLFDENGEEYLDFLSQYGALPFGHNPERGWAALRAAQAAQMPSLIQPLHSAEAERLAERLAEVTPGDLSVTTLANSGAETGGGRDKARTDKERSRVDPVHPERFSRQDARRAFSYGKIALSAGV